MKREHVNPQDLLTNLLSAVKHLSQSAEQQITYLQQLGVGDCADELALELDDIVGALQELQETGLITPEQSFLVRALDDELDRMSTDDSGDVWSAEGLRSSPDWEAVRRRAKAVLTAFNPSLG